MLRKIKVLHIEPTDVCQAACPLCARETDANFNKDLKHHLTVDYIKQILPVHVIQQLNKMFMCGDYGDPAAGSYTLELYNYFRSINPNIILGMNTNGGIRDASWWDSLASKLNQPLDYVVFSIDGLEDTNHIYRRNVDWHRVINNAQAFIRAGGSAHWDMLVYRHNEHQVDACEKLARDLGFRWFRVKVSKRPYISGLEVPLKWTAPVAKNGPIECSALKESSMYIDAQGRVGPCCWLAGQDVDFDAIQSSWTTDPHPTCKRICSTVNQQNIFTEQWQREVEFV